MPESTLLQLQDRIAASHLHFENEQALRCQANSLRVEICRVSASDGRSLRGIREVSRGHSENAVCQCSHAALLFRQLSVASLPKVWYTHEFKDADGKVTTYRVQDVTPDLHQRLVEYYTAQFLNDEVICKHVNWAQDQVSVAEYLSLMQEALCGGYSLVVLEDTEASHEAENPSIVGAGMYMVKSNGDEDLLRGEGRSFRVLTAVVEALKAHGPTRGPAHGPAHSSPCMSGMGMWVRRDRRRRGIAEAIVRGAVASCRGKAVPHFSAFYTGAASQRAAARAGLQVSGTGVEV
ncbi:hypothetical protein ONE63_004037 [Megalurothrips usitatus]|uniref:N-acetyltransferase domain-containing protein n=1 Tax=Megalurothrips usitatus TaxID=439358 RepID=A0AAV7X5N4_9NEOP|nr:hypothetical protein ONE63_004037 [Megalurothrips usitatus]